MKKCEKDILKEKLEEDSNCIKLQFDALVIETQRWLTKYAEYTPEELKTSSLLIDFHIDMKELRTFDEIFNVLKRSYCWSWFSFNLLESIIYLMSDSQMTEDFKKYEEDFIDYCSQRRLYECPTNFSKAHCKLHRPVFIEFPEDIDNKNLLDLKIKFEVKLALIIGVKERDLVLLTYKDGSTVLVYSLPVAVADKVFPLSIEQEERLKDLGVSKCYLYTEPTIQDQVRICN